jgi:O-antigen ligase
LLVVLLPVVLLYLYIRPDISKLLWSRWYNKLILLFALLHAVLAVVMPVDTPVLLAGLAMNLRFFAMFLLAQILLASGIKGAERVKALLPSWLLWLGIVLSILAILQVFVLPKDFLTQFGYDKDTTIAPFTLLDDNPNAVRAFSTMRGPNTLGAFLLLPLAVAVIMFVRNQRRWLAGISGVLCAWAMFLTGSRSAWIGAVVTLLCVGLYVLSKDMVKKHILSVAFGFTIIAALVVGLSMVVPAVRLAVFHSSPGDSHLLEGSSEKHWEATLDGLQDGLSNPLGQGPGNAGPASFYGNAPKISENYYVQLLQEVGVLGLLLFIAICMSVVWHLHRIAITTKDTMAIMLVATFIGISVINIFLHGWADDPLAMVWWGIAGLFVGGSKKYIKQ